MGATSLHREKGLTNREFFEQEFPIGLNDQGEILADATVKGTYYAAVRTKATGQVWALVITIQWTRDYYNFTYRDMDETQGPNEADAPAEVLDLLTPTVSQYAREWRERCRANLAAKAARPKVRKGDVVRFSYEFLTPDGPADTFIFETRNTFRGEDGCGRYRIGNWRSLAYEVVVPAGANA